MTTTLDQAFAELRESRLTPVVLNALDFVVPGEWKDIQTLDALVEDVVGEADPAVAAKAREIFVDPERPYQKALQVYQLVDRADQVAAGAVLANKAGSHFAFLSFLKKFTPEPDTVQAIDLAVKLVAEIVAFGLLEGRPELSMEGLSELKEDLGDYVEQDKVRIAAWVVVDGVLPLGPDFVRVVHDKIAAMGSGGLGESSLFSKLSSVIPGDSAEAKHGFLLQALSSVQAWAEGMVAEHGLTTELVSSKMLAVVEGVDEGTDYLAAAIDSTTSIYKHTGTLTVARACIEDALDEVDEPEEELEELPVEAPRHHRRHRPARRVVRTVTLEDPQPASPHHPRRGPPGRAIPPHERPPRGRRGRHRRRGRRGRGPGARGPRGPGRR